MKLTEIIETKFGKIRGYIDDGIEIYKGIPYTEAPVGDLRFREPHPKKPWDDVKDCIKFGSIAPQHQQDESKIDLPENEDCLYLNIWTPGSDNKKRPVLFWIHGGGFLIEAGSRPRSDGSRLASYGNVVVVSFNYRLGALGFLNLPGIPPNLGIQDQIAALKWVNNNIELFGGDPDNITIFGESAGGQSVLILLAIPLARGLFHRAIVQSGTANPQNFVPKKSREGGLKFLKKLKIDVNEVDQLREVDFEIIINTQKKMVGDLLNLDKSPFWPFLDGNIIPEQPIEILNKGNYQKIPLMIGYNENELGFLSNFLKEAGKAKKKLIMTFVKSNFKKKGINDEDLNKLINTYKSELEGLYPDNPFMYWDGILSDSTFKIPILRVLEAMINHQSDIYLYMFSYKSPKFGFALHSFEIPFIFDTVDKQDLAEGATEVNEESHKLTKIMMDTWLNFARSGHPDHDGIPSWPVYELQKRYIMKLSINPEVIETIGDPLYKIWEGIV
jgi:para-nitrobenzyl esterase